MTLLVVSYAMILVAIWAVFTWEKRGFLAKAFVYALAAFVVIGLLRSQFSSSSRGSNAYDDLEYTEPDYRR